MELLPCTFFPIQSILSYLRIVPLLMKISSLGPIAARSGRTFGAIVFGFSLMYHLNVIIFLSVAAIFSSLHHKIFMEPYLCLKTEVERQNTSHIPIFKAPFSSEIVQIAISDRQLRSDTLRLLVCSCCVPHGFSPSPNVETCGRTQIVLVRSNYHYVPASVPHH